MTVQERRQAIIEELCRVRFAKINNLAFEYGVSSDTISRDILELSLIYPIYTQTGRHYGGVYVQEGFYLYGQQYLSKEQQALLEKVSTMLNGEEQKLMQSIIKEFGHKKEAKK